MTNSNFKKAAKEEKNFNILSIKKIAEKGNKGFLITYSKQLSDTTVSAEIEKEFWNKSLEDIATEFIYN